MVFATSEFQGKGAGSSGSGSGTGVKKEFTDFMEVSGAGIEARRENVNWVFL